MKVDVNGTIKFNQEALMECRDTEPWQDEFLQQKLNEKGVSHPFHTLELKSLRPKTRQVLNECLYQATQILKEERFLKRLVLSNFPSEFSVDEQILPALSYSCEQLEYLEASEMMVTHDHTRRSVTGLLVYIFDNWLGGGCNLKHLCM